MDRQEFKNLPYPEKCRVVTKLLDIGCLVGNYWVGDVDNIKDIEMFKNVIIYKGWQFEISFNRMFMGEANIYYVTIITNDESRRYSHWCNNEGEAITTAIGLALIDNI